MSDFVVIAQSRQDQGKGASRRLRRLEGQVPAIVYGGDKAPETVSLSHKDLVKSLENEAFYSHVLTLVVDGVEQSVILKDLQRHPAKPFITHADFLRVAKDTKLHMNVPLHFVNEEICTGVKLGGGRISHVMTELEITCLPKDLPEFIAVDVAALEVGHSLHISDIALPAGVESVQLSHGADHDLPVVTCVAPKGGASDTEEEAASEE